MLTLENAWPKMPIDLKGLTMKKRLLAALAIIFASSGAWANTLTYQGVTFTTSDQGGGVLQLTITNAPDATGNWSGVNYLEAFAIGNVGSVTGASLTTGGLTGLAYDAGG